MSAFSFFTLIFVTIGSLWGIPWIASSQAAAAIFPSGIVRESMAILFSIGIALTVGADGAWIMFSLSKALFKKQRKYGKKEKKINRYLLFLTLFFSMVSCIPSVYASVIYNHQSFRFLALITLIVNFCYGFYGYQKFLNYVYQYILFWLRVGGKKEGVFLRKRLFLGLQKILDPSEEMNFCEISSSQLMQLVLKNPDQEKRIKIKIIIQYFSGACLAVIGGLIDIYLIKKFFVVTLSFDGLVPIIAAFFCAMPGSVISFIAAKNVTGKLYDILTKKSSRSHFAQHSFLCNRYIYWINFFLSLLAPTSAANIIFHTFSQEGVSTILLWASVIIISLSRIIFSNFTLNNLVTDFSCYLFSRKNKMDLLVKTEMRSMTNG